MSLVRVTVTGADDETDPIALARIAEDFRFVEFGILISSKVKARYPSIAWMDRLIQAKFLAKHRMRLSLHVCGEPLRNIVNGTPDLEGRLGFRLEAFERVQLNVNSIQCDNAVVIGIARSFDQMREYWEPEVIFQSNGTKDDAMLSRLDLERCSLLFDRSGGRGDLPSEWPVGRDDVWCGWAGGLCPDNVAEQLPLIASKVEPNINFWIDAESKLRTDDRFDIDKVRQFLAACRPFVNSEF